jgi:N-acetylmuramoyl-L-alanine amidase
MMAPYWKRLSVLGFFLALAAPATAQVTGLSGWSIYLDPGHSGRENMGVFGFSGAEKSLRVGLALQKMLLETTDIDTVYISRTTDEQSVSLSQRSDHANSVGAAWFHSIHSNAGPPAANNTLLLWGQLLNGSEKNPKGGQAMSDIMTDLLTRGMRIKTIGSRGDCGFYRGFISGACSSGGPYLSVNRRTTMPSELSEAGFHTSPLQNQRNMNADWKRLEAKSFYWSILRYHNLPRPSERVVTGFVTDIETGRPINGAVITLGNSTYTTDTFESLFNRYSSDPDQLSNGFFLFDQVADATIPIAVEADGFRPYAASVTPVDTFFTFNDIQLIPALPPQVMATTPLPDSTHSIIGDIVIDFSRVMDRSSVQAAFSLVPEATGTFLWKASDFQLTFRPDGLDPLTDYTLTISESAEGAFGDTLDGDGDGIAGGDFALTFRSGIPDVHAPAIRAASPRPNARDVERDPIITLTYDEIVDPASVSDNLVSLQSTTGGTPIQGLLEHYVVGGRSLLTFFPESELDASTAYAFSVAPGLRDGVGNEVSSTTRIFFRTGSATYDLTSIDSFDHGLSAWWAPQQSGSTTGIVTDSTSSTADSVIVNRLTGSTRTMRLDYGWDTAGSSKLIRVFLGGGAPRSVLFDSTQTLQAYIFGDGSGNRFRFALDDRVPVTAVSNHEVSPWFDIDWYGWKLVSWRPARDGVGAWLGDGSLDGMLRIDSIQLSYSPGSPAFGTFYIDDLRLASRVTATSNEPLEAVPAQFKLYQNYPNPFNPTTTLRFNLSASGPVTLKIYSLLGAEVAALANRSRYPPGTHEITWDADRLPSGVYFARLEAMGRTQTIRLVLLK